MWRGWFEDREDWDAFAFAAITGSLIHEPDLWELPIPTWHPDIVPDSVTYYFAAVYFLTANPGSNGTWTAPGDWTNVNTISTIGGGGGGTSSTTTTRHAVGGGGGAFNSNTNFSATPNSTTATYQPGKGGVAVTGLTTGNPGTATWFNGTALVGSTVGSTFGQGGAASVVGSVNGGAGGVAATGTGNSTSNTGGAGGNLTGASGQGGSGGGGAGGTTAIGTAGTSSSVTTAISTAGGAGGTASGGAGGGAGNNNGSPGTVFTGSGNPAPTAGAGGGGGGNEGTSTTAGSGGLYGGAGGGNCSGTTSTAGAGAQGLIVISYTAALNLPLIPNQLM